MLGPPGRPGTSLRKIVNPADHSSTSARSGADSTSWTDRSKPARDIGDEAGPSSAATIRRRRSCRGWLTALVSREYRPFRPPESWQQGAATPVYAEDFDARRQPAGTVRGGEGSEAGVARHRKPLGHVRRPRPTARAPGKEARRAHPTSSLRIARWCQADRRVRREVGQFCRPSRLLHQIGLRGRLTADVPPRSSGMGPARTPRRYVTDIA